MDRMQPSNFHVRTILDHIHVVVDRIHFILGLHQNDVRSYLINPWSYSLSRRKPNDRTMDESIMPKCRDHECRTRMLFASERFFAASASSAAGRARNWRPAPA